MILINFCQLQRHAWQYEHPSTASQIDTALRYALGAALIYGYILKAIASSQSLFLMGLGFMFFYCIALLGGECIVHAVWLGAATCVDIRAAGINSFHSRIIRRVQ